MKKLITTILLFGMLNLMLGQVIFNPILTQEVPDTLSKRAEKILAWHFEGEDLGTDMGTNIVTETDICDTLIVRQDWKMALAWFGFWTFIAYVVSEYGKSISANRYTKID